MKAIRKTPVIVTFKSDRYVWLQSEDGYDEWIVPRWLFDRDYEFVKEVDNGK